MVDREQTNARPAQDQPRRRAAGDPTRKEPAALRLPTSSPKRSTPCTSPPPKAALWAAAGRAEIRRTRRTRSGDGRASRRTQLEAADRPRTSPRPDPPERPGRRTAAARRRSEDGARERDRRRTADRRRLARARAGQELHCRRQLRPARRARAHLAPKAQRAGRGDTAHGGRTGGRHRAQGRRGEGSPARRPTTAGWPPTQGWLFHLAPEDERSLPSERTEPEYFTGPDHLPSPRPRPAAGNSPTRPPPDDSGLRKKPPTTAARSRKPKASAIESTIAAPLLSRPAQPPGHGTHARTALPSRGQGARAPARQAPQEGRRDHADAHAGGGQPQAAAAPEPARWPTKLALQTHALAPLPASTVKESVGGPEHGGAGSNTVATGLIVLPHVPYVRGTGTAALRRLASAASAASARPSLRARSLAGALVLAGRRCCWRACCPADRRHARAPPSPPRGSRTAQTDASVPAAGVTMIGATPDEPGAPGREETWGLGKLGEGKPTSSCATTSIRRRAAEKKAAGRSGRRCPRASHPQDESPLEGEMTAGGFGVLAGTIDKAARSCSCASPGGGVRGDRAGARRRRSAAEGRRTAAARQTKPCSGPSAPDDRPAAKKQAAQRAPWSCRWTPRGRGRRGSGAALGRHTWTREPIEIPAQSGTNSACWRSARAPRRTPGCSRGSVGLLLPAGAVALFHRVKEETGDLGLAAGRVDGSPAKKPTR